MLPLLVELYREEIRASNPLIYQESYIHCFFGHSSYDFCQIDPYTKSADGILPSDCSSFTNSVYICYFQCEMHVWQQSRNCHSYTLSTKAAVEGRRPRLCAIGQLVRWWSKSSSGWATTTTQNKVSNLRQRILQRRGASWAWRIGCWVWRSSSRRCRKQNMSLLT